MDIIIKVSTEQRVTALTRAAAQYNKEHMTELTVEQYLQLVCDQNIDAYVAIHTVVTLTKYEFLARFTQEERVAIRTAAAANGELYDFMEMLNVADEVKLTHPNTVAGVGLLEAVGLVAEGRAAIILAQ